MRRSYQRNDDQREGDETQDALESYVREGAQQMLAAVLEEEVNAFLGRHRPGPSPPWAVTALGRHRPGPSPLCAGQGISWVSERVPPGS